jgi:hypothetical protein
MKHTLRKRWHSNTHSSHSVLIEVSKIKIKRSITHTNEVHEEKSCTNITGHCTLMHVTPEIRPYYKYGHVIT